MYNEFAIRCINGMDVDAMYRMSEHEIVSAWYRLIGISSD